MIKFILDIYDHLRLWIRGIIRKVEKKIDMRIIYIALLVLVLIGAAWLIITLLPQNTDKNAAEEALYEQGTLTIGFKDDAGAFSTMQADGTYQGFDVDLADAIVAKLMTKTVVRANIPIDSKSARVALINGEADMVFGHYYSKSDSKIIYCSPYFTDSVAFYVPQYGLDSVSQLAGKKIGVVSGSYAAAGLSSLFKEKKIDCEIINFASYPDVFEALNLAKIDVVAAGTIEISKYADGTGRTLEVNVLPYGLTISFSAANSNLMNVVNDIIKELKKDGTIDQLMEKWDVKKYLYQ